MAEPLGPTRLPHMRTPVTTEGPAREGDPRQLFEWAFHTPNLRDDSSLCLRSYTPSGGGAPRLVGCIIAAADPWVGVWNTQTGAFLSALEDSLYPEHEPSALVTYQRSGDHCPRVATGRLHGVLQVHDGDSFRLLTTMQTDPELRLYDGVSCLAVYHEPMGESTRLVAG
jgi:hypothetical protein